MRFAGPFGSFVVPQLRLAHSTISQVASKRRTVSVLPGRAGDALPGTSPSGRKDDKPYPVPRKSNASGRIGHEIKGLPRFDKPVHRTVRSAPDLRACPTERLHSEVMRNKLPAQQISYGKGLCPGQRRTDACD